jgi:hypothetical protein
MSNADTPLPTPAKKRSRVKEYLVILVMLGIIVFAALYQEQLTSFVALRQWDRGAPARQVTAFLNALQKGDQAAAAQLLGEPAYKPIMNNGKFDGFFILTQAGRMNYTIDDTAPKGELKDLKTEFNPMGKGSALVTAPDGRGQMVDYRLELFDGMWKITEMRGGKPEAPKPAVKMKAGAGFTPPGSGNKPPKKAPTRPAPTPGGGG